MGATGASPNDRGLTCPFCGGRESDRFVIEDRRIIVFACMFSPVVPRDLPDDLLVDHIQKVYGSEGQAYFQRQCDRLHYFVSSGRGQQILEEEAVPPIRDAPGTG